MATTEINVSKADNELYLIATTSAGSSVLAHIKSGHNAPVNYTFYPETILAPGNYTLKMVGINWGGPGEFELTVTSDGHERTIRSGRVADFWAESMPLSI